jgi:glycosyltransferase involved in cell wall biosynthesis
MPQPLVSVIMTVYNEENDLKDSVSSILVQSFSDIEFIIVNDGSTDRTKSMLEGFATKDKRIRILNNDRNLGMVRSLNKAIKISKGKYIARMDSGDFSQQERLKKEVLFLENNESVYIVGTQAHWIDGSGNIVGETQFPLIVDSIGLYRTGGAIHPSIMVRKQLFTEIGLYDLKYDISLEYDLYMRTMKNGLLIANLSEYLIDCRRREAGVTLRNLRTTQLHQFEIKLKYLRYFFNVWNTYSTLKTGVCCLLPTFLLRKGFFFSSSRNGVSNK